MSSRGENGTTAYPDDIWKEMAEGRWERAVDDNELNWHCWTRLMAGTGRASFAVTGHLLVAIKLQHNDHKQQVRVEIESAFRNAWLKLRYDFPTIASRIEYNAEIKQLRKVYDSVKGTNGVDDWLERTFRTVSTNLSGTQWCNADPPAPKESLLFLVFSQQDDNDSELKCHIVFRAPHEIIDGMGTLRLLDKMMAHTSEFYAAGSTSPFRPAWGEEHVNLSPTLRLAADIPLPTSELREQVQQTIARNAAEHENARLAAMPYKTASTVGVHKRVALTLPAEEAREITAAAKSMGATVTQAYHTGIALALRDLQNFDGSGGTVRYFAGALIDHRKDCIDRNSPKHIAAVLHSGSGVMQAIDMNMPANITHPKHQSFTAEERQIEYHQVLAKFTEFYTALKNDKDHLAKTSLFWEVIIPKVPTEALTNGEIPEVPPPPTNPIVTLSSLGRFNDIIWTSYGALTVDNPWITGEELRNGLGLYLSSWNGELTLSAVYNDAYHDEKEAVDFLKSCQGILDSCCLSAG